jgi:hypothetical protein
VTVSDDEYANTETVTMLIYNHDIHSYDKPLTFSLPTEKFDCLLKAYYIIYIVQLLVLEYAIYINV